MANALGDFWDGLVSGRPVPFPTGLDPADIDTIRRLRARDDTRAPDPSFVARLEREIVGTRGLALALAPLAPGVHLTGTPNGHVRALPGPQPLPLPGRAPRRWPTSLATAALVLATVVGSLLVIGEPLRQREGEHPANILAPIATPDTGLPPGVIEDTMLVRHLFDELPSSSLWAGVEQTTLAPGASIEQGTPSSSGVGPAVYRVEAGTAVGHADGPLEVTRAGSDAAQSIAANTEVALAIGDVAFAPSGVASTWRNDGPDPATIMDAGVTAFGVDSVIRNGIEVPGWSQGPVLAFAASIDSVPNHVPAAPIVFTVRRLGLAPGARLPFAPTSGLEFVGVETGILTLVAADHANPEGTKTLDAGDWIGVNDASDDYFTGSPYPPRELRNDGSAPVTLLVMTVKPANPLEAVPLAP
jgi:hypothetical protein